MGRNAKIIYVLETEAELKQLHRSVASHLKPRIQMLFLIKTGKAHSKQELADALGVNHNSTQNWKKSYEQGGIKQLLSYKRGGRKPSIISNEVHQKLSDRLNDPKGGYRSYVEMQQWLEEDCGVIIGYQALNKYVKRKFGARLKAARKSHVQKSPADEAVFKKPF